MLIFEPHEFSRLKRNVPGPSGRLGGYPMFENRLLDLTDPATLRCRLDATEFERLVRYINHYGGGGPNDRIRQACVPPLRRCGVNLSPEER